MSRNFFSTLEIGKLVVFLNSEHTRGKITKLAGRSGNSYATFNAGKKFTDTRGTDRYEVVNLTNARTIEIRIFKGTLKASRILACVEFCHAVARWIQSASLTECEDWSSLWAYVKKHVSDYCHLIAFFEPEHANALATCERQSKGVCAVVASEQ